MAVDDRRHGEVTHLAKAISLRDLREQVSHRCPPATAIPKSWSPTSKVVFTRTRTLLPLSAAATGNPGSPIYLQPVFVINAHRCTVIFQLYGIFP